MDILKDVVSIDVRKQTPQAVATVIFYLSIVFAMDAVLLMPFQADPNAAEILKYIERLPPSLFIGVALSVLVAMGRQIAAPTKVLCIFFSIAGGLLILGVVSILPLVYMLRMPLINEVADGSDGSADHSDENIMQTSLSKNVQNPQDLTDDQISAEENEDEPESESETEIARPMGDGEIPEGYSDPIDDFLKK